MSRNQAVRQKAPPDAVTVTEDVEQDGAAIAVADVPVPAKPRVDASNPLALLQYALDGEKLDPAKLEALMGLVERWQAREAAREFGESFAQFQADLPQIEKTREVHRKDGSEMYKFATMEDVDRAVKPVKAKYRLSTSGSIRHTDKGVTAEWTLQIGSHKETRTFDLPPVPSAGLVQNANPTQNLGAWLSYISRYTYCLALGVVVRGEDTDAHLIRESTIIDEETVDEVEGWISHGAVTEKGEKLTLERVKLLDWLQGDRDADKRSVKTLTKAEFDTLVGTFKIRRSPKPAKGGAN